MELECEDLLNSSFESETTESSSPPEIPDPPNVIYFDLWLNAAIENKTLKEEIAKLGEKLDRCSFWEIHYRTLATSMILLQTESDPEKIKKINLEKEIQEKRAETFKNLYEKKVKENLKLKKKIKK